MNFLQRPCFVLTLSLVVTTTMFTATFCLARGIRQPDSVLPWQAPPAVPWQAPPAVPWQAPPAKAALELQPAAPMMDASDSPAWLIDSNWQSPRRLPLRERLPMVESESFVHLGPLHPHSTTTQPTSSQLGSVQRNNASQTTMSRSLNWFRSLGIQAKRPGNRR